MAEAEREVGPSWREGNLVAGKAEAMLQEVVQRAARRRVVALAAGLRLAAAVQRQVAGLRLAAEVQRQVAGARVVAE